jgi:polysaccharide deacetylase 2 family uncharacterized protein YibQ
MRGREGNEGSNRKRRSSFASVTMLLGIPALGLLLLIAAIWLRPHVQPIRAAAGASWAARDPALLLRQARIAASAVRQDGSALVVDTADELEPSLTRLRDLVGADAVSRRGTDIIVERDGREPLVVRTGVSAAAVLPASPLPAAPAPARAPRTGGDIVLILDDIGFDHQQLSEAMAIDPNLNFAVLPNGSRSAESAETLTAHGFEILCHLPMEPDGFPRVSPGEGAILTSMSDEDIRGATRRNIAAVPHARGVNNHMGSRATSDRRVMRDVLEALPRGDYFIDSKTGKGSVVGLTARAMNIPTASRDIFLDDVQSETAIRGQLAQLVARASTGTTALGIGHIYPVTVRVLAAEIPALRAQGYRFVRASHAVR